MDRAYGLIEIKSIDDDRRVIEGIASTPTPDRMGDVVEPKGAQFKLPLPLLWQHRSDTPVGFVERAKATKDGIPFTARIAKIEEAGELKNAVDKAWQAVKAGLVRGVSIGFSSIKHAFMKDGGIHFQEWEWLELSLVTIPANSEATIQTIKSIDTEVRAAFGQERDGDRPLVPTALARGERIDITSLPGASGTKSQSLPGVSGPPQTAQRRKDPKMKKTIAEQISAFEAKRVASAARMTAIMESAAEESVTLDPAQQEEWDTLETEVRAVDDHLVRLRKLEETNKAAAIVIDQPRTHEQGSAQRAGQVISVKNNLPKGTAFTRYAIALARSGGNLPQALEISKTWHDSTPEVETVLKAAVAAGTTTETSWAAPLVEYQVMASEFIELLRPATIIGRIPGLRRVPFNIKMPAARTGTSVNWVGEGAPKPVSQMTFDSVTLRWAKAAGIVVLTEELVRFSNPAAEAVVRQDLIDAMAQFLDRDFVDPAKAEVSNVSPASITNGVTGVTATGTSADALRTDVKTLFTSFLQANLNPAGSVWIMTPTEALAISMLQNALGQPEFPTINMNGGTFFGLPVVVSENIPAYSVTSPTEGALIILVKASEILLADDGGVTIDVSREASLQMDSAPDNPPTASTIPTSLWQNNLIALRAERFINWKRRRTDAVKFIQASNYGG